MMKEQKEIITEDRKLTSIDMVRILNITVNNLGMNEALLKIENLVRFGMNCYVLTPNVDHIVRLETDIEFREIYEHASLILPDGKPLIWISKIYGTQLKEKISGSDLFPRVCELAADKSFSVFFLGAAEGVAAKAAANLQKKYPRLVIAGTYSPLPGFESDPVELENIFTHVKQAKADILILGLGCPKQEKFFYKYKEFLNVPLALHFGASFDFEAGIIKRAPRWMSNYGLEWLFRFFQEPKRLFKRYFIDDMLIIPLFLKYRNSNNFKDMHQKK